jgi:hypothetical protein
MDAPNPARQMALIRKACRCGNLGKAEFSIPNQFDRTPQSQMNDVAMRAHADGSGEGAGKMELTAIGHFRERRDIKGFVQMFEDEILQPLENVRVQRTVRFRFGPPRVTCGKGVDKLACGLVPEHRPARITFLTLPREHPGQIKKRLVVAAEPIDQLRFKRTVFGGSERKFVRSNRNKERIEVLISVGAGIKSSRTDGEGAFVRLVIKRASRQLAFYPGLRNEATRCCRR